MQNMLNISVREFLGPFSQFVTNLLGKNGLVWWDAFKVYLRKENPFPNTIDLQAKLFCPDGYHIWSRDGLGEFLWTKANVDFFMFKYCVNLAHGMRRAGEIHTNFNANVLDFLLKPGNQHLIFDEWKGKTVFFWGTTFKHIKDGNRIVRCLTWSADDSPMSGSAGIPPA